MQIIKDIFLDFYDQNFVRVNAKQGDTARYVQVEIIQDNTIFSIPTDATASIACGDVWNVCTITENKILAPLKGLLDKPGEKRCQIELLLGSDKLTTISFKLNVEPTARNDGAIEGSNELSVLDRTIVEAMNIVEEICGKLDNGDFVGPQGTPGEAATISINNVTTGEPGTSAIVENVGTPTNAVLDITIPQGIQGIQGPTGEVDANSVIQFLEASQRSNICSGDSISIIFGKQGKWYTDLKSVAFSGSYNDLEDTPNIPNTGLTGYEKGTSSDAITQNDTINSAFSKIENQVDNRLYIGRNRIAIQTNDDLNDYITPGSYVASYAALVASLSNCPVSGAQFTMDVVSDGAYDGRVIQIIHAYTATTHPIYVRYLSNGTTWQSWCKFLGIDSAGNYTTGTITATSVVTLNNYVLPKSSNGCVMGHAELTTNSTISRWTGTQLLTLSIKPDYNTMILFYIAADNGYIARGWMGADGKLYIYSNVEIPSGTTIYPQWNYITNS